MKLFKNQKGFNDVITVTILGGIIGAIFIGGVFVWKEVDKVNAINNLYSKLSSVVKVEKEVEGVVEEVVKDKTTDYINEKISGTDLMKFESKDLGFSFEYPSDWNIAFRDTGIFISNFIYNTEGQVFSFPDEDSSVISIYSQKKEIPITSPIDDFLGGVIASKTIVETGEQQTIGPVPRILSNITVSTNYNDSYYSISLRPFDSKYKDVFEKMLSSFKFLDEVTIDTSDWFTYNNEELGFSFEYPNKLGEIEWILKKDLQNETDAATGSYFLGRFSLDNSLLFGGASDDFSAGRGASLLDARGYTTKDDEYLLKLYTSDKDSISIEPIKIIHTYNDNEVLLLKQESFESGQMLIGDNKTNIAAIINFNKDIFKGIVFRSLDSDLLSQGEFEKILESFNF